MKTHARRPLVLLAVLLLITAAAGGFVGWRAHAATGKARTVASTSPRSRCMYVLAGKRATADGSVLMGYNNDWTANTHTAVVVVPATPSTYQFVKLNSVGQYPEGGINTRQFAVCYGAVTGLNPVVAAADPYPSKGVGKELWDQLLANCANCRQALDYLQRISTTTGFSGNVAGSFGMSDANEAWAFELFSGHHWVAARVPDTMYYVQPNLPRIRQIDLSDRDDFRGSPDLVSFAQSHGLYDPASGPFDAAWAYGDHADMQDYTNTNRLWGVLHLLSPSRTFETTMPYATRPVFVAPDAKLTPATIMGVHRYHYEGSSLDQTAGYTLMSPHSQTDRPICCSFTDYAVVFQTRHWLPDGVGGVMWFAPSRPCSSGFTPFYCSITGVPTEWGGKTAFGAIKAVADSLDKQGTVSGETRYRHYSGLVRSTFADFYSTTATRAAGVEAAAAALWSTKPTQAIANLTAFSSERATADYDLAKGLPAQMP